MDRAGAVLTVDLAALSRNYQHLKKAAPNARVSSVVKANGYGTGAVTVAKRLAREGCDLFFVGYLDGALELRRAGDPRFDQADIAVLNGLLPGCEAAYAEHGIIPVLNSLDDIARWRTFTTTQAKPSPAYIHIDTGMNRLGLPPEEFEIFASGQDNLAPFPVPYVLSHLACADEPDHPLNAKQLERFKAALSRLPDSKASLANSAGTLNGPPYHFDMVRPGVALYGGNPFSKAPNPMESVVGLKARVLQVRQIGEASTVGYGATYKAATPRRVATLSLGYADGIFRALSASGFAVRADGYELPLVGRVSMDLVSVDISAAPEGLIEPGAWVSIFGDGITVDDVGAAAGTIGYEILTSLGSRYAKRYVEG
jgi:alanine racemase